MSEVGVYSLEQFCEELEPLISEGTEEPTFLDEAQGLLRRPYNHREHHDTQGNSPRKGGEPSHRNNHPDIGDNADDNRGYPLEYVCRESCEVRQSSPSIFRKIDPGENPQ